jgi:Protein of unknown function DUF262/Protein of unknown function (DUF1524)
MESRKPTVAELIIDIDKTFLIPPYQRPYEWKQDRWQALVQDIVSKATSSSQEKKHWLGIVLTSQSEIDSTPRSYRHRYFDLIDGQQRIMTLRVWLQAILDHATDNQLPLTEHNLHFTEIICQEKDKQDFSDIQTSGAWRRKWRTYRSDETGLLHCYTYFRWILWLGQSALTEAEPDPLPKKSRAETESSLPIEEQWQKALERRASAADEAEIESQFQLSRSAPIPCDALIKATLTSLSFIELERQELLDEDPSEIFQALNGERTPLEQFDHVRNQIFTGIKESSRRKLFHDEVWRHYESALNTSGVGTRGSSPAETFLYDFLISIGEKKHQKSISKAKTSVHFSRYVKNRTTGDIESVANEILLPNLISWIAVKRKGESFAVKGDVFQLPNEIKRSLHMMEALSSGPVVPLLMNLVGRYFAGEISLESLRRQVFFVEIFLGRKVLRRSPLSPLRSEMMNFIGQLGQNFSEIEFKEAIKEITPSNDEIQEILLPRQINKVTKYDELAFVAHQNGLRPKQLLAIFQAIEEQRSSQLRHNLLESTATESYSIEHIYPQDSSNWRNELRRWNVGQSFMDNRLHTLGNLAVIPTRLNSRLSNLSFHEKTQTVRDPETAFPRLRVNEYWLRDSQDKWTPDDIDERAKQLVNSALKHWVFPE